MAAELFQVPVAQALVSPSASPSTGPVAPLATAGSACFIEHPRISQLSAMLKAVDAGDRIIKGRLELFSCTRKRLSLKQQKDIQRRSPQSMISSPLGPMSSDSAQVLLVNLCTLMSLLFVDYDCTSLLPDDFMHCKDKHEVVNTINHNLAVVVDRSRDGFLAELWRTVQEVVDINTCEIWCLDPNAWAARGGFGPTDSSLMSFHYFFVDNVCGRILFVGGVTKSRSRARSFGDVAADDSDISLSDDAHSVSDCSSSKERGSSSGSGGSLMEGEYAFGSDQSDDAAAMSE
eukprot:gnl/TRDRNA2_/TRDRNA2_190126_c0_seq1.p1 gnl/TRDRNA2_/TRDRNA2_190126_c0~~gnl/TRDRNA2_/TRDRNA2_190126_c0_seq1.p1  ORF type:complete len:289 (-),score=48.34 gnl/TRDRNA2_/TRDRNA2_190126_c0_seq1:84-950(-)